MENEVKIVPDELFNGKVFLPEDDWMDTDISEDWLDPTDEWETAKNSLYIGDAPVCAQGGLTLLTGQSGNGKTMTLAMMMAAVFRRKYGQFELGPDIEAPTILYVDTEMEKYNTQRLMNRVYYLNGWEFKTNKPQFRIIRLRDTVNVKERWRKVLKAIDEVKPTFCFLDGLLDLVEDFNDNKECHLLIRKLMSAATWYDISLVGVIHQNPGGDKMAGHIGSFGERKAITVLATKKDKNGNDIIFKIEQKKARDKDANDLSFRVEDDRLHIGIPVPADGSEFENKQEEEVVKNMKKLFNVIFDESHDRYTTGDFEDRVRTAIKQIGLSGGKGSDYTVASIKDYFVGQQWVANKTGDRGAKFWVKNIPFV